jgi:hypothetical protein
LELDWDFVLDSAKWLEMDCPGCCKSVQRLSMEQRLAVGSELPLLAGQLSLLEVLQLGMDSLDKIEGDKVAGQDTGLVDSVAFEIVRLDSHSSRLDRWPEVVVAARNSGADREPLLVEPEDCSMLAVPVEVLREDKLAVIQVD